jgi:hypothetical protein
MPASNFQEWESQNSQINYPFSENNVESSLPKDFIVDVRFFLDKQTERSVYLRSLGFNGTNYSLEFCFSGGTEVAISGSLPATTSEKKLYIWGNHQESVLILVPGSSWGDSSWNSSLPLTFSESESTLEKINISSGVRSLRRIKIADSVEDESSWRKDTIHKLQGGSGVLLNRADTVQFNADLNNRDVIEISADFSPASADTGELFIKTINGIAPTSLGKFLVKGLDCIKDVPKVNSANFPDPNAIKIKSECLPCCGCNGYQLTSDAIAHRYNKLVELRDHLQSMVNTSVAQFNLIEESEDALIRPVAKIGAIRISKNTIKIALQNVSTLPIYGRYGVSISGASFSYAGPSSVPHGPLPAPEKYKGYSNSDSGDIPVGDFTGVLGPISSGSYVDLVFNASLPEGQDLRAMSLDFDLEANGYFGTPPQLGCSKYVYSATSSPDDPQPNICNGSTPSTPRYTITETEAP